MKKYSVPFGIGLVIVELFLISIYFLKVLPTYNNAPYEEAIIENEKNPVCSIFVSQKEAQSYFNNHKNENKRLTALDHDGDGIACENLP